MIISGVDQKGSCALCSHCVVYSFTVVGAGISIIGTGNAVEFFGVPNDGIPFPTSLPCSRGFSGEYGRLVGMEVSSLGLVQNISS